MRQIALFTMVGMLSAGIASADVRTEEKSQFKFAGALGRVVNIFGGKAAREGVTSTVTVKGDRKMTSNDRTAQIVDLAEEKVYDLDLSKKTYTVTTFAEMRRQAEEARRKAAEQTSKESKDKGEPQPSSSEKQYDVDFNLKESGQRKPINGFDAREVIMTIAVREKGKALEQGGMVMTTSSWLAPKVPNVNEVAEFDRRFAEKLALPTMLDAQQMAAAMAMYPMMADAMKRMQAENVRLDGTPVMTTVTVEAVAPPDAAAKEEKKEESAPRSLGGLGGALARRAIKKDKDEAETASAPGRTAVMTMQHELLKVTPAASAADVAIPEGFKQKS
jgi:hypothetical protein